MECTTLEKKFLLMGARLKVSEPSRFQNNDFSIDIRKDSQGEFFDIKVKENKIDMRVLDIQKEERHLLLLVKQKNNPHAKFLCGHDERSWFTCAVPEREGASTVFQAKQALKPKILRDTEDKEGIKTANTHKRHRKLETGRKIHRQGEFFFIEQPGFVPSTRFPNVIHKNEPMSRGGGSKPHMAEYLYRTGGTTVYVSNYSAEAQDGLSEKEYQSLLKRDPKAAAYNWRKMVANAGVYVKGKITHNDHKTLDLNQTWYRVEMNTEGESRARSSVRFLD